MLDKAFHEALIFCAAERVTGNSAPSNTRCRIQACRCPFNVGALDLIDPMMDAISMANAPDFGANDLPSILIPQHARFLGCPMSEI